MSQQGAEFAGRVSGSWTRILLATLVIATGVGMLAAVDQVDGRSLASALARITGWQFALICGVYGLSVLADTAGWRATLARGARPSWPRLFLTKCAGDAVNVLTALGALGGEATKAWLLRREIPYATTVPSLLVTKTSLVLAQALLLAVGIALAWSTGTGSATLVGAMGGLLLVEVIGIGGFVLVQVTGVLGRAGRLFGWAGGGGLHAAQQLDRSLRDFYRREWRSLLRSAALHFAGWMVGAVEAFLVLRSLGVPASLTTATVVEALGSGVRFATFFVPANLGTLEGANAAAFTAFGWTATAGLAFSLVRRARQGVWIAIGLVILVAMDGSRLLGRGLERDAARVAPGGVPRAIPTRG
jgi:glycosyltransferase 2 family protein